MSLYKKDLQIGWSVSETPVAYPVALTHMQARVEAIIHGKNCEWIWLLEHPPIYTSGTRSQPQDLLDPKRFPVYQTGRGGQYTYHGPGQRILYVLLDLRQRKQDIRTFIKTLEAWILHTLTELKISAYTHPDQVGIWVQHKNIQTGEIQEKKIAAIGVRLRKWVSFHGIALNVNPNLEHFSGIIPCGLHQYGVTSINETLAQTGVSPQTVRKEQIDTILKTGCEKLFGPTQIENIPQFSTAI